MECKDIRKAPASAKLHPILKDNRKVNLNSCFLFDYCIWKVNNNVIICVSFNTIKDKGFSHSPKRKHLQQISKCFKNIFNPHNNPGKQPPISSSLPMLPNNSKWFTSMPRFFILGVFRQPKGCFFASHRHQPSLNPMSQ